MNDESTTAVEAPPATKAAVRRRWPGILAVFLGTLAFSGILAFSYVTAILDHAADTAEQIAETQAAQAELRGDLVRLASERQEALQALRADQEERRNALEESLRNSITEALDRFDAPAAFPEHEWKLAEVEFLLRMANQALLMERNVEAALRSLKSAAGVLARLDDLRARRLRATLAADILSLEHLDTVDVSGIYLRLDALKLQLSAATLAAPDYRMTVPESVRKESPDQQTIPPAPSTFLQSLVQEFGSLVRFRRIDTDFIPVPAPAEAVFLELNLRLMLEQAQLAALKHDQAVYAASLDAALQWAKAHLGGEKPEVGQIIDALQALRALELAPELPDISATLHELESVRRETP